MEPSKTPSRRGPLQDLTNTITEDLDSNARRRQRDRERYASMSADKKNERNRKRRERYMENKMRDDANSPAAKQDGGNQDPHDSRQEELDANARKTHGDRERFTLMDVDEKKHGKYMENQGRDDERDPPIGTLGADTCIPGDQEENDKWLHRGSLDANSDAGIEYNPDGDGLLNSGQHTLADMCYSCIDGCTTPLGEADGNHSLTNCLGDGDYTADISVGTGLPTTEDKDCDENVIFEEDEDEDKGCLFGGQDGDEWDADEDVVLDTTNEDPNEPDVPDLFGAVYANVPDEGHILKPVDNCKHCNAKKFESEPPGFCCRSGDIQLYQEDSTRDPEFPPELKLLWTSSNADARHFRQHLRHFNGHFSFTSLYCQLDSATTDTRKCPIYTFRVHG